MVLGYVISNKNSAYTPLGSKPLIRQDEVRTIKNNEREKSEGHCRSTYCNHGIDCGGTGLVSKLG
jgi:hypothetical protein